MHPNLGAPTKAVMGGKVTGRPSSCSWRHPVGRHRPALTSGGVLATCLTAPPQRQRVTRLLQCRSAPVRSPSSCPDSKRRPKNLRTDSPTKRMRKSSREQPPLTCSEYDTDRPTKPALRLCLEITANRAANRTMQLPTHSSRTASHLPADTQTGGQTHTRSQFSRDPASGSSRRGWGGGGGVWALC